MGDEGADVVPDVGTSAPEEEEGVGFIDNEGEDDWPDMTLGIAETEGVLDEGEEGEGGTLFGDSVGLDVGAQCAELKFLKTRQLKFKSKIP